MFIQPHDPDFVPEPIYPEYIPLEDEHILPAEEQPSPPVVSPTAESPGYVAESDPEEDPKEYEDDETEDGPVDYPMDGGDDGDDDDGDSSGYNADDEDEDEEDKEDEEEEEHLASTDFTVVIPTDELDAISFPPEAEVERLLAMPTPSPSDKSGSARPQCERMLILNSAGERPARCTTPATLPSPPLPPSLYPPPPVYRRDDIPKFEQPPRKRVEMRHQDIREVGYGIRDTWIDPAEAVPEMAPTTLEEVNTRVTQLAELHEHDTKDLYALLEDPRDGLREADRVRQSHIVETLRVMRYMRREMGDMQAELLALRREIMAPVTRQGQNPPPPNTDTSLHHMTLESVQAMIDQTLLRNSTNGDGSQSSHEDNLRNVQTTRPSFYADFMKCHPLNFKGNEGVVGTIRKFPKEMVVLNAELQYISREIAQS
nr:hypothetical protein [Tanacetum cinerariifolium]